MSSLCTCRMGDQRQGCLVSVGDIAKQATLSSCRSVNKQMQKISHHSDVYMYEARTFICSAVVSYALQPLIKYPKKQKCGNPN